MSEFKRLKKAEKESIIINAFCDHIEPPENLWLDEWADKYRMLPQKSSAEYGQYRTDRFPFLRKIMRDLSPQRRGVREVAVQKGSQLGFTELCVNRILYNMDVRPVPHLYIQKTIEVMRRFSKQRFEPSLEAIERIKDKVRSTKGRGSKDTADSMLLKSYPGGILILGGANSAASLRSAPISDLDVDEWDSFEVDVNQEGDPAALAKKRTTNFPQKKIFYLSTPKTEETSKIEPKFLQGDQQFYFVKCMECNHTAPIIWAEDDNPFKNEKINVEELKCFTIGWDNSNPDDVYMVCQECGAIIEERHKTFFLSEKNGAYWKPLNPDGAFPSYHISALYSPLGFYSWKEAVEEYLDAELTFDREKLKVFTNTGLGKTFSEKGERISAGGILKRREVYSSPVPEGCRILVCGTDIQKNRIEAEIVGFGKKQESWSIDYRVFMGDTEYEQVWIDLDNFLKEGFLTPNGRIMKPAISMIDSGYKTEKAYHFCHARQHRMVYPVKGVPGWGKGLFLPPKKKNDFGVFLFSAYVDEIKSKFYSHMTKTEPGPGYCHFPLRSKEEGRWMYDKDYFKMLLSEVLKETQVSGQKRLKWELPKGRRNEGLDCRVYALCGLSIYNPNFEMLEKHNQIISGDPRPMKTPGRRRTVKKTIY